MRINQSLGVLAPQRVRRKRARAKLPPWYAEVPPETVDIALEPRVNRYARGPLKFHRQGSTQRKVAERLELFRDTMGIVDPKLIHTPEEMIEGLKEVMAERARLLGEFEMGEFEMGEPERDEHEQGSSELDSIEATPGDLNEPERDEDAERANALHELLEDSDEEKPSTTLESGNAGDDGDDGEPQELFGQPTDWLLKRLAEQQ